MKVLFVVPSKHVSGASIAALNIMIGLRMNDVDVHLVTSKLNLGFKKWIDSAERRGINVHYVPFTPGNNTLYWLVLVFTALNVILKERVNIVHLHLPKEFLLGVMSRILGLKVVLTVEGDPIYEVHSPTSGAKTRVLMWLFWMMSLRFANAVAPCSAWLGEEIGRRFGVRGKVKPVYNPVDVQRFEKAGGVGVKKELGVDGPMVLLVARLVPVKGIKTLIRSIPLVVEAFPKTQFIVAGEGPMEHELREFAKELRVDGSIRFIGFRSDVDRITSACDVLTMTSYYEPFGMPAAEAGACGKPVVTTDAGGLPEIVENGVTGFVVPVSDHVKLSEAIMRLLKDPGLRARMGKAGKARVQRFFTPRTVGAKMLRIYNNLYR